MKRREFFKTSLMAVGAVSIFGKMTGLFQKAIAAAFADDTILGKQGYVRNVIKADAKALDAIPAWKTQKKPDFTPMCLNCKQFKTPAAGWGNCAMVGAMGPKKVCELGLCKVYQNDPAKKALKPTLDPEKTV